MVIKVSGNSLKVSFYLFFKRSLKALHSQSFIHADLKPANVMWSTLHGKFKLLDFGLTFHTEEQDLHPIQSSGKFVQASHQYNLVYCDI